MMTDAKSCSVVETVFCRLQPSTALLYPTLLYPTLLCATLLCTTLHYSAQICSALPYSALLCSDLLWSTLHCSTLLYSTLLYSPAHQINTYSPLELKLQSSFLGISFFDLHELNMLCRAVPNCRELRQRPYRALVRDPGCLILISVCQFGSIRSVTCPAQLAPPSLCLRY